METPIKPEKIYKTPEYMRRSVANYKQKIAADPDKREKSLSYMRNYYKQYYINVVKPRKMALMNKNIEKKHIEIPDS
jgi:hypothetical protein